MNSYDYALWMSKVIDDLFKKGLTHVYISVGDQKKKLEKPVAEEFSKLLNNFHHTVLREHTEMVKIE